LGVGGIGDWGLGIGDWAIPNPQSPLYHKKINIFNFSKKIINFVSYFNFNITK